MATKAEAVRVARKFRENLPDLANRSVRVEYTPPRRYNGWFEWRYVNVNNPRDTRVLTGGPVGSTHFVYANAGDVHIRRVSGAGLPVWNSFVIYPHMESLYYCQDCTPEFSLEEKIESAEWAIENDLTMQAEDTYYLEEMVRELKNQIRDNEEFSLWLDEMGYR